MSKITMALKRASEERSNSISPVREGRNLWNNNLVERKMRKSWSVWIFVTVAIVAVLTVFNYQGGKDAVPLSEIFPDEEVFPVDVEYEFVQEEVLSSMVEDVQPVAAKVQPAVSVQEVISVLALDNNISSGTTAAYTIQLASFKDKKKAEEALVKIQVKVPSAYIGSRNLGAKGVWYRIYAGQFELRSDAEVALGGIKPNYNSSFIISPKRTK